MWVSVALRVVARVWHVVRSPETTTTTTNYFYYWVVWLCCTLTVWHVVVRRPETRPRIDPSKLWVTLGHHLLEWIWLRQVIFLFIHQDSICMFSFRCCPPIVQYPPLVNLSPFLQWNLSGVCGGEWKGLE